MAVLTGWRAQIDAPQLHLMFWLRAGVDVDISVPPQRNHVNIDYAPAKTRQGFLLEIALALSDALPAP